MFDLNLDIFYQTLLKRRDAHARLSLCWSLIRYKYLYVVSLFICDEFRNAVVNNKTFIMRVV